MSALIDIPTDINKRDVDYKTSMEVFKNYWAQCTDLYIFWIQKTFTILIKQILTRQADLNIRDLEQKKVEIVMHFLIEMADKKKKNTLCAFPKDRMVKRRRWEDIMEGDFQMVNGQHCIEASKQM